MRNGCPRPLRRVLHPLLDVMFPFILLPPRHAAATLLWAASAPHRTVSLHDAGHDAWRLSGSLRAATSVSAFKKTWSSHTTLLFSRLLLTFFGLPARHTAKCVSRCACIQPEPTTNGFALWSPALYKHACPINRCLLLGKMILFQF